MVRGLIITVLVLLWAATAGLTLLLVLGIDPGFDVGSATTFLGTLGTGLTAVVSYFGIKLRATKRELEEERFSTPMALAFGYVRNFLDPAVTALIEQSRGSTEPVKIHVYIPEHLEELEPLSRQRTLARIREANFRDEVIKLQFDSGRVRDIITVTRTGEARPRYFDFPTTLLTLTSLVDYKIATAAEPMGAKEREALGRQYIEKFRDYVLECTGKLNLAQHVELTDRNLGFLNASGGSEKKTEPPANA